MASIIKSIVSSVSILLVVLAISVEGDGPVSTEAAICVDTPDPTYCWSLFAPNDLGKDIYDYGRHFIGRSLSRSHIFIETVEQFLEEFFFLPPPTVRALMDCRSLSGTNTEFLTTSSQVVNATTGTTLSESRAEDVHTWLSAVVTNQQTCLDGLQAAVPHWNIWEAIFIPIYDDLKLFGVCLALFIKGWAHSQEPYSPPSGHQPGPENGRLLLKMSSQTQAIYDSIHHRRKLLQADEENPISISNILVVSQDGSANCTNITSAVNLAPNNTDGTNGYFLIYVTAGIYKEYVSIPKNKNYLIMIGDGINQTVVTGNRNVVDGWTTFGSATFSKITDLVPNDSYFHVEMIFNSASVGTAVVSSSNFIAVNMTFRNTAGPIKQQAVAMRNSADFSIFYSCSFEGYQDTLYAHSLRQFYRECYIYGTVDFIFGNAAAVFQDCNLYPRQPMRGQSNTITAQGRTDPNQNTGISIQNSTITATEDLAASNYPVATYLGRPWKEYARAVYIQSFLGGLIAQRGWLAWNGTFALNTSYFGEYDNKGPGSGTADRVNWLGYHVLNETEAAKFTVSSFFLGEAWLTPTGVPYDSGLLV